MKHQISKLVIGLLALLAFAGEASATVSAAPLVIAPSFTVASQGGMIQSPPFAPSGIVNSFNSSGTYSDNFTITTGTTLAKLFTNITTAYPGNTFTETLSKNGTAGALNLSSTLAANSSYTLNVHILGAGFSGYSMKYSITSVPEPTEGALFLFGIGLVGFMVFRRKNHFIGGAVA